MSKKLELGRSNTLAVTLGTTFLVGFIAFGVIKNQNNADKTNWQPVSPNLVLLANPEDSRFHHDLVELENKLRETKRLLFARENALENARMRNLREKFQQATEYANNLKTENEQLKNEIGSGRQKIREIEKTSAALLETLEIQKKAKADDVNKIAKEYEELATQQQIEKDRLQRKLQELETKNHELYAALESKDQAMAALETETAELRELLAGSANQFTYDQMHAKSLKSLAEELRLEVDRLEEQLREHEQTDVHQQLSLDEVEKKHQAEKELLLAEKERLIVQLEQVKKDIGSEIAAADLQAEKNRDLDETLKNVIARSASREQDLYEEIQKRHQDLADQEQLFNKLSAETNQLREALAALKEEHKELENKLADKVSEYKDLTERMNNQLREKDYIVRQTDEQLFLAAKKGAELEDDLSLGDAHTKALAIQMNQEVTQESNQRRILEKQVEQLTSELDIHRQLAQNLEKNFEYKLAELADLNALLAVQKEQALARAAEMESKPAVRDLARENELERQIMTLEQNLSDLRHFSEDLQDRLAGEKALASDLAVLLESQSPIIDISKEKELQDKLNTLEAVADKAKESARMLNEKWEAERYALSLEKERSRELEEKLQKLATHNTGREDTLQQQVAQLESKLAHLEQEAQSKVAAQKALSEELASRLEALTAQGEAQIQSLKERLSTEEDKVQHLTYQLEHQQPVRDFAREQELEKQIQLLEASLQSERNLANDLATRLDNIPQEDPNLKAEIDRLKRQIARDQQNRAYDLFQAAQRELSYKEQIVNLENTLRRQNEIAEVQN